MNRSVSTTVWLTDVVLLVFGKGEEEKSDLATQATHKETHSSIQMDFLLWFWQNKVCFNVQSIKPGHLHSYICLIQAAHVWMQLKRLSHVVAHTVWGCKEQFFYLSNFTSVSCGHSRTNSHRWQWRSRSWTRQHEWWRIKLQTLYLTYTHRTWFPSNCCVQRSDELTEPKDRRQDFRWRWCGNNSDLPLTSDLIFTFPQSPCHLFNTNKERIGKHMALQGLAHPAYVEWQIKPNSRSNLCIFWQKLKFNITYSNKTVKDRVSMTAWW